MISALAKQFGTPLYVYDGLKLKERCKAFRAAFRRPDTRFFFAVKANFNPTLLKLIFDSGFGADVVSQGELEIVRSVGLPADKIMFSGVGKTNAELKFAIEERIHAIQIESPFEWDALENLGAVAQKTRVSLRVNLDIDAHTHRHITTATQSAKFGMPMAEAERLAEQILKRGGVLVGLSCHLGSQIKEAAPFREATKALAGLASSLNHNFEFISLGGGLGIGYRPNEATLPVTEYAEAIEGQLKGCAARLHLEPGRWIVAPCGRLLATVLGIKTNGANRFVVIDAGMNDLIRPALYEAHHEITSEVIKKESFTATVVGPVCETADTFATSRSIPAVDAGDVVAIENAGAYGMSMASNYNGRPRPAEILVTASETKLIRRRETIKDFVLA